MEAIIETTEPPLFENAHQALTYAYEYSNQQFARSVMAVMMSTGMHIPSGKGLSGLDGAGQAGMVKARVRSLGEVKAEQDKARLQGQLEGFVLVARYARRPRECAHCGCMAPTAEWREAIAGLVRHVNGSVEGISHLHLRRTLVERYFGTKVDMSETAKQCGVSRVTAAKQYKTVKDQLRRIEERAMKNIEQELQDHGLLAKSV
jgi:hypothetical protein